MRTCGLRLFSIFGWNVVFKEVRKGFPLLTVSVQSIKITTLLSLTEN